MSSSTRLGIVPISLPQCSFVTPLTCFRAQAANLSSALDDPERVATLFLPNNIGRMIKDGCIMFMGVTAHAALIAVSPGSLIQELVAENYAKVLHHFVWYAVWKCRAGEGLWEQTVKWHLILS